MRLGLSDHISDSRIAFLLSKALKDKLLDQEHTGIIIYDLSYLEQRLVYLKSSFMPSVLHTTAVKANPLTKILTKVKSLGFGAEVASFAELHQALKIGFDPSKIVFDSPVKTIDELRFALSKSVYINANSLEELFLIDQLYDEVYKENNDISSRSSIGLRLNPQVGKGSIDSTSLVGVDSKFGVPIELCRAQIIEAFCKYAWLTGIHFHIGSQGVALSQLVTAASAVEVLLKDIEYQTQRTLSYIDIGGGFPVSYHHSTSAMSIANYADSLHDKLPYLYNNNRQVITEFGRYLHANTAFAVTRVEYVTQYADARLLHCHFGADLLLRVAYAPKDWKHDFSIYDAQGNKKFIDQGSCKYTIAGPLCFSGDVMARQIELPTTEKGDYIVFHDIGAYALGMWSHYNSRQFPAVWGVDKEGCFELLRKRDTLEDVVGFWE